MKHGEILRPDLGNAEVKVLDHDAMSGMPWLKRLGRATPHILLLQGPAGPMFRTLQNDLEKAGFAVNRVRFHNGDRLYANARGGLDFTGNLRAWRYWLTELVTLHDTKCILLYGSERPVHRATISIAHKLGIPVLSLEEGYIRPGYVTAELGGNNANAPLARALPVSEPRAAAVVDPMPMRSQRARMFAHNALHYTAVRCSGTRSKPDTHHREIALGSEVRNWARNVLRKWLFVSHDRAVLRALTPQQLSNTFIVPLQVTSDCNLKAAANGWTNFSLIRQAIQSFAQHAAPDQRLIFKLHPMDRGHSSAHLDIARLAQAYRVADRVDFVSGAEMGPLVKGAAGMVTINSSAGLSALHHKTPLLVLGQALYAHPELATVAQSPRDIDSFWNNPKPPDRLIADRFLNHLKSQSLLPGDFYSKQGMAVVSAALTEKVRQLVRS